MTNAMHPDTLARLKKISVATLCTQLFKRGFRNVYIQGIARLTAPSSGNMVGPAYTMRNIPAREDLDQISAFDNPDHPQRKGIESVHPVMCWCSIAVAKPESPPAARSSPRG